MSKISLLILAGGLGSRYKGAKQIDGVGQSQETLMEYALYDAINVGITKFVFVINNTFPENYKQRLSSILENRKCEVYFVEQTIKKHIPNHFIDKLTDRKKPLGTAHAVLCAKDVINEPFITINADDFYGRQTFKIAVDFIRRDGITKNHFGMLSFILRNTLSNNGSVSRGICSIEDGYLKKVEEFTSILRKEEVIFGVDESQQNQTLLGTENVSMNCWILHPHFFQFAESDLSEFLDSHKDLSSVEFYLPSVIDNAIQRKELSVKVLETPEKWFGLTYQEDRSDVVNSILTMVENELYPNDLWK